MILLCTLSTGHARLSKRVERSKDRHRESGASCHVQVAHWDVKGPNFIALHELFDRINKEVEDYVDDIAERSVQLGGIAEGAARMVNRSTLRDQVMRSLVRHSGDRLQRAASSPQKPAHHFSISR
jgi:hypothetical protein